MRCILFELNWQHKYWQILKMHLQVNKKCSNPIFLIPYCFHSTFLCTLKYNILSGSKSGVSQRTLAEACGVVDALDPKVKKELLNWFISMQLQVSYCAYPTLLNFLFALKAEPLYLRQYESAILLSE